MPILAGLITSLFGGIASLVAIWWGKKIAVSVLAVAAFALALTALMAMFNLVVTPLIAAMFSTTYGQFIGLAFPPMAGTCLAAIGTCWCGCALYKLKIQAIRLTAAA